MSPADFNQIALDPHQSVVVEACAGSGKTWLLVSRIIRLLLAGVAPAEIIAITFTHKAAGEMRARLDEWLRFCATASDQQVSDFLRARAIPEPELDAKLRLARGLFETVLSAQPGINIYTFHAWFLEIIRRAPLETGLIGQKLAEQTQILRHQAWSRFTEQLAQQPDAPLTQAMQDMLADIGLSNSRKLLQNFVQNRAEWWAYTENQADPLGYASAQLRAQIELDIDLDIGAELMSDVTFRDALDSYAQLLALSTDKRHDKARTIRAVLDAELIPAIQCERLSALILTQKGEISVAFKPGKTVASQALYEQHQAASGYLLTARQQLQSQASYRYTVRGLRLGIALLNHYQMAKQQARVVDFIDIEWQAAQLLSRSDHAEYIQMKLDARYRHILLDEFQDTNPIQWRILQAWFEAAHQSHEMPKIFLVGDPKQSIYRFRGAQAGLFKLAKDYLTERGANYLSQNHTHRNAANIIKALNATFAASDSDLFQPHQVYDVQRPGRIEIMALSSAPLMAAVNQLDYRNPLKTARLSDNVSSARAVEAQQLAQGINKIVTSWVIDEPGLGTRLAQYRDIMILVRNRTHLYEYEQALKQAQIPYLSNRRGGLLDSMEVGDLLALLHFLSSPNTDQALARVLRSSICSCSDADLMQIRLAQIQFAEQRYWWPTLLALHQPSPALQRALQLLQNWLTLSGQLPVHDLLDRIYFEANLLERYQAIAPVALQSGIRANLIAFMALTLTLTGGRYPGLPRFLADLANLRLDPEENPDEGETLTASNAVSIHTVHGAKGLESPVVWILDAGSRKTPIRQYSVLFDWPATALRPRHFSLLAKQGQSVAYQQIYLDNDAQHAQRENLNLLYVAMTRARQALLVSAVAGSSVNQDWHGTILSALSEQQPSLVSGDELAGRDVTMPQPAVGPSPVIALPDGIRLPIPTGLRKTAENNAGSDYGTLVHRLLETMTPPNAVIDETWIQSTFGAQPQLMAAWQQCQQIIALPHLQRFFDPLQYRRAHNELSYLRNSGSTYRIDRVVEFDVEVWALDYKTDQTTDTGQLMFTHRTQLQEYQAALRICYPGKSVYCALINRVGELIVL